MFQGTFELLAKQTINNPIKTMPVQLNKFIIGRIQTIPMGCNPFLINNLFTLPQSYGQIIYHSIETSFSLWTNGVASQNNESSVAEHSRSLMMSCTNSVNKCTVSQNKY